MKVTVKFFANIKKLMGKEGLVLDLDPGSKYTIQDILQEIVRIEKKELYTLPVKEGDIPLKALRVVLNGRLIPSLDGVETTVEDGDTISLFPLLAGG